MQIPRASSDTTPSGPSAAAVTRLGRGGCVGRKAPLPPAPDPPGAAPDPPAAPRGAVGPSPGLTLDGPAALLAVVEGEEVVGVAVAAPVGELLAALRVPVVVPARHQGAAGAVVGGQQAGSLLLCGRHEHPGLRPLRRRPRPLGSRPRGPLLALPVRLRGARAAQASGSSSAGSGRRRPAAMSRQRAAERDGQTDRQRERERQADGGTDRQTETDTGLRGPPSGRRCPARRQRFICAQTASPGRLLPPCACGGRGRADSAGQRGPDHPAVTGRGGMRPCPGPSPQGRPPTRRRGRLGWGARGQRGGTRPRAAPAAVGGRRGAGRPWQPQRPRHLPNTDL